MMNESNPQLNQSSNSADEKDPYCPTSETGRASDCKEDTSIYDDASITRTIEAAKNAFELKKQEFEAVGEVIAAETALVKKSTVITVVSLAAAFIFSCFSWIVINITLAIGLVDAGMHYLTSGAVLLLLNMSVVIFALYVAKNTYKRISLRPVIEAIRGHAGS